MENSKTLDKSSDLPPLRIHHFLTWMIVAALSFALLQVISNRIGYDLNTLPLESSLPLLFQTMAATTLGFIVYWYRHGHRLLEEPGQGLVLLVGVHFLWEMLISTPLLFFPGLYSSGSSGGLEEWSRSLIRWSGFVVASFEILFWGFLYFRFLKFSGWRTYFLVIAVLQLAAFLVLRLLRLVKDVSPQLARMNAILYPVPTWILHFVVVAGLAYLVLRDLRSRKRHHWSHWCGVVCALIIGIRDLNMSIMQMMVQFGWMA